MFDQQECILSKIMKPDSVSKPSFYNLNFYISSFSLFLCCIYLLLSGHILTKLIVI